VWSQAPFFRALFLASAVIFVALLVFFVLYSAMSRWRPLEFDPHREYSIAYGEFLAIGVGLGLLGLVPVIDTALASEMLKHWRVEILSSLSLTGILSITIGRRRLTGDETQGLRAFLLRAGLLLLVGAFVMWLYRFAIDVHSSCPILVGPWEVQSGVLGSGPILVGPWEVQSVVLVLISLVVSAVLGLTSDINHVSMHRYYRDRLLEAYMPDFTQDKTSFTKADKFWLHDVKHCQGGASPYQIINTNVTIMGPTNQKSDCKEWKQLKYRARCGDSFIFSPLFVGSEATGYAETRSYRNGEMSLATALSISGAAVDPNTGSTRSRPLSLVMTLLNLRLGYWARNPRFHAHWPKPQLKERKLTHTNREVLPPIWHYVALREMLGWRMNEYQRHIRLSDGGHFENLGLYELIKRKCPYIIVSDAGADPKWTFRDLSRACELVRADFGAEVDIDIRCLRPNKKTKCSKVPFARGTIDYRDGTSGVLFYLKTTMFKGLPVDIQGYKRAHDEFPDEATTNQFFREAQFEAYRELGFRIGKELLKSPTLGTIPSLGPKTQGARPVTVQRHDEPARPPQ
jgi:hypothetical protein